jgi:hypothetical protein
LGFTLDKSIIEQSPLLVVKPQLRLLNHSFAIVTSIELCFYLVLACVLRFTAGISLLDEVNQIVTWLLTRGDVVLRLQGLGLCDMKPYWCVPLRPNR